MNVLLVLLLVALAGCVSQAQPITPGPVAIEPADQPILDAFLRHIDTTKSNCTPERMAQYAAQPEDITWQAARIIEMPLIAFQLTGEQAYLDEFVARTDTLLALLTEDADGHPGWYGLPLELFRNPEHPDEPVDVIITSLTMAGLLADFALVVREAGLEAEYAAQIERYLPIARALVDKWDARGNYRVLPGGGAVYITHERLAPLKAHLTQPHNKHSIAVFALASLYEATGDERYIERRWRGSERASSAA